MLIYGKNKVNREELKNISTPPAEGRFQPVPHYTIATLVAEGLIEAGFTIECEEHVTARDGLRYFGGFAITKADLAGEKRRLVCGVRNANDKTFAAAICIGSQMMVCSNLQFSSERMLARRHTKHIMRDLPAVISETIATLIAEWNDMEARIASYESKLITREEAADMIYRITKSGHFMKAKMYDVIERFLDPALDAKNCVDKEAFFYTESDGSQGFDEDSYKDALNEKGDELNAAFGIEENLKENGVAGSLWGFYNAVTAVLKGSDFSKLPARTMQLQVVCDALCEHEQLTGQIINEIEDTEMSQQEFEETFRQS